MVQLNTYQKPIDQFFIHFSYLLNDINCITYYQQIPR